MISISPDTTTKRPAATSPCLINNSPALTGCLFPAAAMRAICDGVSVGKSCSRRSGGKRGGVAMETIRCRKVWFGLNSGRQRVFPAVADDERPGELVSTLQLDQRPERRRVGRH